MLVSDLFALSTRMFKARTSRTALTILGMSVGIGAILFLVSLGYGLQRTLLEKITTSDSLLTLDVTPEKESSVLLTSETIQSVRDIKGVSAVSPAVEFKAQGKQDDLTADLSTTIVDPLFLRLNGAKLENGDLKDFNDDNPADIIVSSSVAKIFGKTSEEIIGGELKLAFFIPKGSSGDENAEGSSSEEAGLDRIESDVIFRVVGTVNQEDNVAFVNAKAVPNLPISRYSQVKVRCNTDTDMATVKPAIEEKGFFVSSLSETVDQANKIFNVIKIVLMLFGVIALVVSAIGMFNTMTITLLERTEEIGIMKSIGASDTTISLIFIMESTIMGFLGGFVGVVIGWLEGFIFNGIINLIASRFGGEQVNLFWSPMWFVITVLAFSAFVGFLTGVVPARRASRIDPLEALRYK